MADRAPTARGTERVRNIRAYEAFPFIGVKNNEKKDNNRQKKMACALTKNACEFALFFVHKAHKN